MHIIYVCKKERKESMVIFTTNKAGHVYIYIYDILYLIWTCSGMNSKIVKT